MGGKGKWTLAREFGTGVFKISRSCSWGNETVSNVGSCEATPNNFQSRVQTACHVIPDQRPRRQSQTERLPTTWLGSDNSWHRQRNGLDKWVLVIWAPCSELFYGLFSERLSSSVNILTTPERMTLFLATKRRHKVLTSGAPHGRDEVYLEFRVSFRKKTLSGHLEPKHLHSPRPTESWVHPQTHSSNCWHKTWCKRCLFVA